MGSDEQRAVDALRRGEPVLLPTDGVYGLCAAAGDEAAVDALAALKGRPGEQPIALIAPGVEALLELLPELPPGAAAAVRTLLPGAFTLVVPDPAGRFARLSGANTGTLGVRVAELPASTQRVLEAAGPVAATSANRHGGAPAASLDEVPTEIREGCGAELDAGTLGGVPSTVLDLTGDEPRVLREGAVPADEAIARLRGAVVGFGAG